MSQLLHNSFLNLSGKVALVTGGSRGIGKGIAKILVESGATVYITGRKKSQNSLFPSVLDTSHELNQLQKGKCHGVFCDHSKSDEINAIFEEIRKSHRKLDILVNSVLGTDKIEDIKNRKFWEVEPEKLWDDLINVGMRSAYICSVNASKIMVPHKSGLIANISSMGSIFPIFGTLYAVGKEGTDRMSVNMGIELRQHGITVVSLWPAVVRTERNKILMEDDIQIKSLWEVAEDPELAGRVIASLANCKDAISLSSRVHFVADLAQKFDLKNNDGTIPISPRSFHFLFHQISPKFSATFKQFLKAPLWALSLATSKFSRFNQILFSRRT